jgi:hypothetical protein
MKLLQRSIRRDDADRTAYLWVTTMKSWMFYAQTGQLLDVIKAYTLAQAKALFLLEHPVYRGQLAQIHVEIG